MPVWPFLWSLCAGLLAYALWKGDRQASIALAVVAISYVVTRLVHLGAPPDLFNVTAAVVWLVCAGSVFHLTPLRETPYLLALIPLCYFGAYATGAGLVVGSLPYFMADVFAILAMLTLGHHAREYNPGSDLVGGLDRCSAIAVDVPEKRR